MTIMNITKIKLYLYLNKNTLYIYNNFIFKCYQFLLNVVGVQNPGEMPL
jgi:predicted nucleic acid-binding Zn finger protein